MRDVITTCVLYTPSRPIRCLHRALLSLDEATTREHHVEVVVQGPLVDTELPEESMFSNIKLRYYHNEKNLGSTVVMVASIERFLKTDHAWWAKCDDDISFEAGGWDMAVSAIQKENALGKYSCACAMIAVPNPMWSSHPRILTRKKREGSADLLVEHKRAHVWRGGAEDLPGYAVCDLVDIGCTVYARNTFENGCLPDTNIFSSGDTHDFALTMLKEGFKSILVTNPRCQHHHNECKPWQYNVMRYDREPIRRAGQYLIDKWNVEVPMLTTHKGLSQLPNLQQPPPSARGKKK